jgi:hypothetical protein
MVATSRTLSARTGHALLNHLSQHVGSTWQQRAAHLLNARTMGTRVAEEFVLHEDHHVVIKGNTQGDGGYLYVCAYPKVPQ